jgi:hypothetical protein
VRPATGRLVERLLWRGAVLRPAQFVQVVCSVVRVLKTELHGVLRDARAANLTTLEGLGEFDLRRTLPPTGANRLGVVTTRVAWNMAT